MCIEASNILPNRHPDLGELIVIDGSLIDAVLSMAWADYRKNSKKAKIHLGFNINIGEFITYLLLAIYCHENHGEHVNIKRVRQLRIQIQNELRDSGSSADSYFFKEQKHCPVICKNLTGQC
uniref:Uncharacterized protein n=1 Tax=uncultured Desulfobacterium sp. TaxID=201089 RepID=E1YCR9_9BACT|nr:hypothetical protein N47_G36870 [uncultured Desulfobacterium sp.]